MKSDIITKDEFNKIARYLQPQNKLALQVACKTGLRIGDVLQLTPSDIIDNTIHFVAQKTGKPGSAKIPPTLAKKLLANSNNYWLFPGRNPSKHRTRQAVFKDMQKACNTAKLTVHATPHSTRKLFAVETANKRGLTATMKALQHSSTEITKLYITDDRTPPPWAWTIANYIIDRIAKMLNISELP